MRPVSGAIIGFAALVHFCIPAQARPPTEDGFRRLNAGQIRQALVGREFSDDVHFRYQYQADGKIIGQGMGQKVSDRWRIADQQLCMISRGRESCYFVWKKGKAIRLLIEDSDISIDGQIR